MKLVLPAALTLSCALSFATSAQAPPKRQIVNIGGGPDRDAQTADWPKLAAREGMSEADRASSLEAMVTAMAARDLFSGVVLVAKDGKPVLHKAWGLASREYGVSNRADTRFNIGSIDKTFTAAAIRLLAKDGKLSLDDVVAKHLPDYKGPAADRITIRQLLEHSSGMGDIFTPQGMKTPRIAIRKLGDFLPAFEEAPLKFEPGKGREYSNAGYVLLGLIVEKESGKSFDEFYKERIFQPLGMTETGPLEADAIVPNRATGYTRRAPRGPFAEPHANTLLKPGKPSSAGGGDSTADDLLRFGEAGRRDALGLGLKGNAMGIAGGMPGANAVLEVCANGITIVTLSNVDPPSAEYVADRAHELFGCAPVH